MNPPSFAYTFYTQKTVSEINIDCLRRKIAEAELTQDVNCSDPSTHHVNKGAFCWDKNVSVRESEAIIVIKQLQEKVFIFSFGLLDSFIFSFPQFV